MSARRFGGRHSAGAPRDRDGGRSEVRDAPPRFKSLFRRDPVDEDDPAQAKPEKKPGIGFWARSMMFAPTPLLFAALGEMRRGDVPAMIIEFAAFAMLVAAAWLLREGIYAQIEYDRRKTARRPAAPRKIFASALTGLGVALAAGYSWGLGWFAGPAFGLVAAAAHLFAFGPDPLRDKGMKDFDARELDRAAEAVDRAEALLEETLEAARGLADRDLRTRVGRLVAAAREVLAEIEEDPRDLRRSRRFLSIYLVGARNATVQYAKVSQRDAGLHEGFDKLLTELDSSFARQRSRLLSDDRDALEVEIEVLKDRLKQEGAAL